MRKNIKILLLAVTFAALLLTAAASFAASLPNMPRTLTCAPCALGSAAISKGDLNEAPQSTEELTPAPTIQLYDNSDWQAPKPTFMSRYGYIVAILLAAVLAAAAMAVSRLILRKMR